MMGNDGQIWPPGRTKITITRHRPELALQEKRFIYTFLFLVFPLFLSAGEMSQKLSSEVLLLSSRGSENKGPALLSITCGATNG